MADSRSLSERLSKLPPGRHLVPRDFVTQNQRERMLLATAELVAERGYQKTTIELIAKTARVALSTFYEQFSSKEECFLAAFDETLDAAAEVFSELLDPEQEWADQIASGLEIALEMVVGEPARAQLCIVEAQAAGGEALKRYQGMLERIAPKLREGRAHNPRAGRLPDGLEVALVGGLAWLLHQRLIAGQADEVKGLLPEMLQVTLTPYVGEVEAGRAADAAQARAAAA
ncbi:MAG TPA: TetR/AcrR family transcriptional regulator [Solirubrobacterales bacterium]|jgi:AcrR family transcriptional regulator|nr:TetR/AcrR family transcriptional regulator [Solirubrobacterales bacterium]